MQEKVPKETSIQEGGVMRSLASEPSEDRVRVKSGLPTPSDEAVRPRPGGNSLQQFLCIRQADVLQALNIFTAAYKDAVHSEMSMRQPHHFRSVGMFDAYSSARKPCKVMERGGFKLKVWLSAGFRFA